MSIRVMSKVWSTSAHKGSALLLLLAIADFAHDDGTGAWPSIATLADKVRMSPRQVTRLLHRLEASGELVVKPGASRYDTNLLSIPMRGDNLAPLRDDRKGPRGDKQGRSGVTRLRHPKRPPSVNRNVLRGSDDQEDGDGDDKERVPDLHGILKAMP